MDIERINPREWNCSAVVHGNVVYLSGIVADDKSLPKEERKQLQIEHAPNLSPGAKVVKLADKISNITDILERPPSDWDDRRRREYVRWGEAVVAGVRGVNAGLERHFDELVERAGRELDPGN